MGSYEDQKEARELLGEEECGCGSNNPIYCNKCFEKAKLEIAKQIFEKQERHVLKELAWVVVKIQKEKDNPIWKQDKGNLEEWLRFIKEQRPKFLQEKR